MNRQITHTENETVINKLSTNKSPGPDGFIGEFYQTFREELINISPETISEEGKLLNSFCEATITLD